MSRQPIDVTIVPARPEPSLFVHAVALDEFEEAVCDFTELGELVAWRFETYYDSGRTYTLRLPVGADGDPLGPDWEPAQALAEDDHRTYLAALAQQVAAYDARTGHTTTEENR